MPESIHDVRAAVAPTLRPVVPGDESFLLELYGSTRADEIAAWDWNDAERTAFLTMQARAQQQAYRMQFPSADHGIIVWRERAVGRLVVDRGQGALRLVDIALLPEFRGRGLGTRLLETLLAEARRSSRPIQLHVLATSPARRLYRRLGFVTVSENVEIAADVSMEWRP